MRTILSRLFVAILILSPLTACAGSQESSDDIIVTLIFTNDMESAYAPVPAWWRDDMDHIGGIAELATLIKNIRRDEPNVFLFDSGDIFTGALSRLTDGALMFEFMITMGYDAMAIGNHEFDYGEAILEWQKNRAPFPVLGANLNYRDTNHPFAQRHTIIERDGIRIGVIGTLGQDAASSAIAPPHIDELDVSDPAEAIQASMSELRDEVDLIVVLTHQGHTAPMQTDAEADPRLTRDIDKDIALAGAVQGIDVLFGGHADAGTWEPVVNPDTGTLIMQTFGQATYLGYLQLTLDANTRTIKSYDGKLLPVDSDRLEPDEDIEQKMTAYRAEFPEITEVVGHTAARLNRRYFDEADLGNLLADVAVEMTGADIGLIHPGTIRKDIPQGAVEIADILDTNPFVDPIVVMQVSGAELSEIMEQSFTLLRGLMQVSGLDVVYDTSQPERQRLVSLHHNGVEVREDDVFTVAVPAIIAGGGDHYDEFLATKLLRETRPLGELTIDYFKQHRKIEIPKSGRQRDLAVSQ
ncbi:MAG: bifunctional UDP-sugar hydrolase/5'-nucleotidase [Woeseiaceae bacterium]|nr:bifunctional UDP-sugar hydrolase/5'-nucleotidase [Woeseiaceae bacterium]MDX2609118.1 bifunctional UDP-sugar hydrolase/5'-nucleotidase [Woeseiaceae bacterium]